MTSARLPDNLRRLVWAACPYVGEDVEPDTCANDFRLFIWTKAYKGIKNKRINCCTRRHNMKNHRSCERHAWHDVRSLARQPPPLGVGRTLARVMARMLSQMCVPTIDVSSSRQKLRKYLKQNTGLHTTAWTTAAENAACLS